MADIDRKKEIASKAYKKYNEKFDTLNCKVLKSKARMIEQHYISKHNLKTNPSYLLHLIAKDMGVSVDWLRDRTSDLNYDDWVKSKRENGDAD